MFTMRKSLFGRTIGISSSGGLITFVQKDGTKNSSAADIALQGWGKGMFETVSSAGSVMSNCGVTIISTDSTSGTSPIFLGAPVQGVKKEIFLETSATLITFNTTATTIVVGTTTGVASTGGSTALSVSSSAVGISGAIVLRGRSSTKWAIESYTQGLIVSS